MAGPALKKLNRFVRYLRMSPTKALATVGVSGAVVAMIFRYVPDRRTRWIAVGCVLGIVVLVLLVRAIFRWRSEAKARSMVETLDEQHQRVVTASPEEQRARVEEMRRQFREAIEELRRAKKTIYDLPWFLLIGEPQSGKSMTLRGSELNFPVGTERLSGLGGTRNCDWWFANQAVILDTAGRFTFQEEGAPDRAEWEGFLGLLGRKRPRCPINGVIVVVPVDALLSDPPEVRKDKAKNIHAKLGELQRKLGVQFPVFLVITKCDLVVGFSEFFRDFGEVHAAQIVGWSNEEPFDRPYDATRVERDLDTIYGRLRERRLEVLRQPISFEERGLVYSFPEEFRALAEPLRQYLDILFAPDIYHDPLFFRGFYFTSGMQEGDPIVKVGRDILTGGRPGSTVKQEFDPLGNLFPSRPFFIADVYKAKVLREAGMVFRSAADIRRGKKLKVWTYAGGGVLCGILALFLVLGGLQIRRLIRKPLDDAMAARSLMVEEEGAHATSAEDVAALVDGLDKDADNLEARSWWFRLTFPLRSPRVPVNDLRRIRDALYVHRQLRPAVSRVAAALAEPGQWSEARFEPMRASLREYIAWYAAAGPDRDDLEAVQGTFDRLFAPVSAVPAQAEVSDPVLEAGELERLRGHFLRLFGDYGAHERRAIPQEAGEEGGEIQAAFRAAKAYYLFAYAGEEGEDLGPWVRLLTSCQYIQRRLGELLALAPDFDDARTIDEYQGMFAEWKRLYSSRTEAEEAPSYQVALNRAAAELDRLEPVVTETQDGGTDVRLVVPKLEEVRKHWVGFFGSEENAEGETLYALVERSELEPEVKTRITGWITAAVAELDAEAERVIRERIHNRLKKLNYFFTARGLHKDLKRISDDILSQLDAALPDRRVATIGRNFDDWENRLPPQEHAAVQRAKNALQAGAFDAPEWDTAKIALLVEALGRGVRRHTWFVELAEAERLLAGGQLESMRGGFDEVISKGYAGFEGIRRRHLQSFMLATLDRLERLQKELYACTAEAKSLRGFAAEAALDEDAGGEPDPAKRVFAGLDRALEAYARRYFDAWRDYYLTQNLDGYDDILKATTWDECYELLLNTKPSRNVHKQAERQLSRFVESVLEVDEQNLSKEQAMDRFLGERRAEHNTMLGMVRDSTARCGGRFRQLKQELRLWYSSADTSVQANLLAGTVERAYADFQNSIKAVGGPDASGNVAGPGPGDLKTKPLEDIQKALRSERIIQQLDNIMKWSRYWLNVELDNRLAAVLEGVGPGSRGLAPFPFRRPEPGTHPPELTQAEFAAFLIRMLDFEAAYAQIGQTPETEREWRRTDATVGRREFIDRCRKWRFFLYGGKEGSEERLHRGAPKEVFFDIQHKEPTDYARVGERDYMKGTLSLGMRRGDTGRAVVTRRGLVDFQLHRSMSPPEPENRVWLFGQKSDVWLRLSEPHAEAAVPPELMVEESECRDTIWGLPMFIYRYRDSEQFAVVQWGEAGAVRPGRVWDVPVPIRIRTSPENPVEREVYALFEVSITACGESEECELPPPIGSFSPSTRKPVLWDLN